jgi:hypothetical protein
MNELARQCFARKSGRLERKTEKPWRDPFVTNDLTNMLTLDHFFIR